MTYSAGVPAKNEEATIEACIRSIFAQTLAPRQVFVCTNGCTDGTVGVVEALQKEFPTLVHLQSAPGKANAWNEIFSASQDELLMFVDADCYINETAAQDLEHVLTSATLLIAGGSSLRIEPRHPTLFTRFSDTSYGVVDQQRFLNGKLYMVHKARLAQAAARLGVDLIPPDTISDGHFLEKVCEAAGGYRIIKSAYAIHHPITNFKDWLRFRLRVSRGRRHLMATYEELFPASDFLHARLKNYAHRFAVANTISKKVGAVIFAFAKEGIDVYVRYFERAKTRPWLQIASTKSPF